MEWKFNCYSISVIQQKSGCHSIPTEQYIWLIIFQCQLKIFEGIDLMLTVLLQKVGGNIKGHGKSFKVINMPLLGGG